MRTRITIYLSQVERVKEFVDAANKFESDVDIIMGHYVVNAKSILGVLSLDLSGAIDVEIHSENPQEVTYFNNVMLPFESV